MNCQISQRCSAVTGTPVTAGAQASALPEGSSPLAGWPAGTSIASSPWLAAARLAICCGLHEVAQRQSW